MFHNVAYVPRTQHTTPRRAVSYSTMHALINICEKAITSDVREFTTTHVRRTEIEILIVFCNYANNFLNIIWP